jgi:[acyl-carrier-protein] S-malonyltransferase
MGILFTRGPALSIDEVERLCRRISSQGRGLFGAAAVLSRNAALLIGQGDTVDRFMLAMSDELTIKASLRRKPNRYPPLHTPLVRKRCIPNRAAVALYNVSGGGQAPSPKLFSCVTGDASYTEWNSREILIDWTDHPQRLWDVIHRTLASETRLIVHVGPAPTLIPATFSRLSENVIELMRNRRLEHVGRYVIPGLSRHTWLTRVLPAGAALIRAPFVTHLILEDWLVTQEVP